MTIKLNSYSEVFRTKMGVRQGGVLSPKLFAIFVDDLLNELESTDLGIKVGRLWIAVIMYADDILLMAETKEKMSDLLKVIKFNPDWH